MTKISLIGAGQIGGTLAHLIGIKELVDEVVLFDVASGIAKGKALDIAQSSSVDGFNVKFSGTDNYVDIKNSDVIIITAGVPRKPGMSRDDLLGINLKIIKQVAEGIKEHSPDAFIICITNPLDVMVMALQKYSGLPTRKVVGMAGILDSSRFKFFLSKELEIPLIASHEVFYLNQEMYEAHDALLCIGEKTYVASAYLNDEKKILPCAAYLGGEYGIDGLYAGVPAIIGKNGVEKIEDINLEDKEKKEFMDSIDAVKKLWKAASAIDPNLSK